MESTTAPAATTAPAQSAPGYMGEQQQQQQQAPAPTQQQQHQQPDPGQQQQQQQTTIPSGQPTGYNSPLAAGLNADGTYKEGWTQAIADMGLTRLANRLASSKTEGDALRSLDHALGLVGKKVEPGPPKADASPQDIQAYREAVGIPLEASGYELEKGIPADHEAGKHMPDFAKIMHEGHVPKEVAGKLMAKYAEMAAEQSAAAAGHMDTSINELAGKCKEAMEKKWGAEHDSRHQANKEFVSTLGLDMNDPMVKIALSQPFVIEALDSQRRNIRGQLPGQKNENHQSTTSPRQEANEYMRENPDWKKVPEKHAHVQKLYQMERARKK